jgi:hypothetical protein
LKLSNVICRTLEFKPLSYDRTVLQDPRALTRPISLGRKVYIVPEWIRRKNSCKSSCDVLVISQIFIQEIKHVENL